MTTRTCRYSLDDRGDMRPNPRGQWVREIDCASLETALDLAEGLQDDLSDEVLRLTNRVNALLERNARLGRELDEAKEREIARGWDMACMAFGRNRA